jgi:hypothetical protein
MPRSHPREDRQVQRFEFDKLWVHERDAYRVFLGEVHFCTDEPNSDVELDFGSQRTHEQRVNLAVEGIEAAGRATATDPCARDRPSYSQALWSSSPATCGAVPGEPKE